MLYLVTFLEGIITFISPCLLPMLPVYIVYFAGGEETGSPKRILSRAIAFVLGFTTVFLLLGAFSATLGRLLIRYQTAFNLVTGALVVLFGLGYLGVFKLVFPGLQREKPIKITGLLSAYLFGMIFSISWTPCVGAFLGSALTMAAHTGSVLQGVLLLLAFSAGLGIPFVLSAVLIDRLKSVFNFIKQHYTVITRISGILLIVIGLLMMTGVLGRILLTMSFV